ncbi:MAG TPA: hypothetical protein VEX67_05920 [Solirubrobacteraceae bacterium]|nr:hypothetical protein [Solirubrobacteraceae bacterium]
MIAVIVIAVAVRLAIGASSLSSVQAWLHIGSPYPECSAAGIGTPDGREGTCARRHGLFAAADVAVVVNGAHTLRMPEYTARVVDSAIEPTTVYGRYATVSDYPGGHGVLASFRVRITNTTSAPLAFDADGKDIQLLVPSAVGSRRSVGWRESLNAVGARGPSFAQMGPIAPNASVTGWATFVTPLWTRTLIHAKPSDLEFFRPGRDRHLYGHIRLWK